ncbi:hypothetical protein RUM43_009439 [Polyplax serrata]|uniref:Uncharacterized protein n=1 Tax=Polyplax serrata TaxID=468196 RepID=A0AAN8PD31_POLSC
MSDNPDVCSLAPSSTHLKFIERKKERKKKKMRNKRAEFAGRKTPLYLLSPPVSFLRSTSAKAQRGQKRAIMTFLPVCRCRGTRGADELRVPTEVKRSQQQQQQKRDEYRIDWMKTVGLVAREEDLKS